MATKKLKKVQIALATEDLARPIGRNQRDIFVYECFSDLCDSSLFRGYVFRSFASLEDKFLGYQQAEQMPDQHPAGSPKALNAAKILRTAMR